MPSPFRRLRSFSSLVTGVFTFGLTLAVTASRPTPNVALGASASKECYTGQPAQTNTSNASFALATAQTVEWQATYGNPVSGCNGNDFYLSRIDFSHAEDANLALTTSGQTFGTKFLNAGSYYISIKTFYMGPGFYYVYYNQAACLSLTATSGSGFTASTGTGTFGSLSPAQVSPSPGPLFTVHSCLLT